jgi:hypothetical protein
MDVAKRVREAIAASAEARKRRDNEEKEARKRRDAEQREAHRQANEAENTHRRELQRRQDQQAQQVRQLFSLLKQFKRAAFPKLRVGLSRQWSWLNARVEFRRWMSSTVWGFEIQPILDGNRWTFSISPPTTTGHRGFPSVEGLSADGVVDYLAARAEEVLDPARDASTPVQPRAPTAAPTPAVRNADEGAWYWLVTYIVTFVIWIAGFFVFSSSLLNFFLWLFLGWIPSFVIAVFWPLAAIALVVIFAMSMK